jgi:hypothetical protein
MIIKYLKIDFYRDNIDEIISLNNIIKDKDE